MKIEYSDVDRKLNLSLFSSANFIQNIMIRFLGEMNLANNKIRKDYNAFWVVSKLKIHFKKYPKLLDTVAYHTFISGKSKIRLNLDYIFSDSSDSILFLAKQELCPVDWNTRKIKKLDCLDRLSIDNSKMSFSRWGWNIDEFEKCYDYTVLYCDTDSNYHVNNTSYIRFILNAFDSKFFDMHTIRDLEIHYINECHEKDTIIIYKKTLDNKILFIITCNNIKIIEAKLII